MISFFIGEHLLNIIADIYNVHLCNTVSEDPIKIVLINQLKTLFYFTTYSTWKAILGKYISVVSTFIWSFMDLFVMLMSVGLAARFRQLNDHLYRHKGQVRDAANTLHADKFDLYIVIVIVLLNFRKCPKAFGQKTDYTIEISVNCVQVWTRKCPTLYCCHFLIICISFACNCCGASSISLARFSCKTNYFFFFKCSPMPSFVHAAYFWVSLFYLLSRTLAVSLYSSSVYEESKRPIKVFRAVPMGSWSFEVKHIRSNL